MKKYLQIFFLFYSQSAYHAASQPIINLDTIKNNFKTKLIDSNAVYKQIQNRLQSIKSFHLDSILRQNINSVLSTGNNIKKQMLNKGGEYLNPVKKDVEYLKSVIKQPLQVNSIVADISGYVDSSFGVDQSSAYVAMMNLNSEWNVAGIPATVIIRNQTWSERESPFFSTSVRFDKDNYLKMISQRMSKYDPVRFLKLPAEMAQKLAEQAKNSLHQELESLKTQYNDLLVNEISFVNKFQNITSIDLNSLRRQFMTPEFIKGALEKEKLLVTLQEKVNSGTWTDLNQIKNLQKEVLKFKAIQDFITKIDLHRRKWESSGLLKKIKDAGLLKSNRILAMIKDPSTIRKMAKEYLSLKGLEKLFLNINKFDLGQNALSLSPMSFRNFLNNGLTTEFLNKGKSILVLLGKQKDINSILDSHFENNLFSTNNFASAARIELKKSSISSSHLSVSSFSQSLQNSFAPTIAANFRKVMVTTYSNDLTIGQNGLVSVELSRSASQYRNPSHLTDSTIGERNPLATIFSGENLFANSALSVKYSDQIKENGLSYQFNFSKVSNGYINPGNSFLSNGSSEWGINIRKTFVQNRLQLSAKTNNRSFSFGMDNNHKWINRSSSIDVRWKIKKGQFINMRYQPVKMNRIDLKNRELMSSIDRLTVDANLSHRFNKVVYRNFITVSYQGSSYVQTSSVVKTTSLAINSYQSISLRNNLLFVNTSFNKTNNQSGFIYLNTSAIAEAGYTYRLFEKLSVSSGLFYNKISGWYEQIGIRQSINGQIGKSFSINVYIDAGKNISIQQNLLNQPVRADLALRYTFENGK